MPFLRALGYFFEEAFTSLWRGRLINALSVATIAVSLFVTGAFLAVAGSLNQVVTRWVLTGQPERLARPRWPTCLSSKRTRRRNGIPVLGGYRPFSVPARWPGY